jgi:O-acetyl-ADP-ribose deacetylase (regulator of RNase III)
MKIEIIKGDITKVRADAIVNAANASLMGGGGVDGAIHQAGGPAILQECLEIRKKQGKCGVGQAVITTAGNLPAKYVIHTVGPQWNEQTEGQEKELASCYQNSLKLAEEHQLKTISFPNISTGIYRFPKKGAAEIAIAAVQAHLAKSLEKVFFVCFDQENYEIYQNKFINLG